jgi:hypothetical protein
MILRFAIMRNRFWLMPMNSFSHNIVYLDLLFTAFVEFSLYTLKLFFLHIKLLSQLSNRSLRIVSYFSDTFQRFDKVIFYCFFRCKKVWVIRLNTWNHVLSGSVQISCINYFNAFTYLINIIARAFFIW